jgi:ATP-binding cassette, subfamily F, member 3
MCGEEMISVSNLKKTVSGVTLFEGANIQIYEGEKIGLIGANGTGKTTLFRLITGETKADDGTISIQNNIRIAYFSQSVDEMAGRSALEEVIAGNDRIRVLSEKLHAYHKKLEDPGLDPDEMMKILEKMGDDQAEYEAMGGYEIESEAQEILTGLGITPEDHGKPTEDFSGGWKMRIALAKVLIVKPDLILMDEPTNYLDMETIIWLENWLMNFKGAFLMTTHDREFMNGIVKKIVEISNGKITSFSGNYDYYEREKAILLRNNEAEFTRQQSMLKKEEEFIARFKARASHAAQVQSRVKKIDKIERVELVPEEYEISIELPQIPRGGNDVISIKDLGKSWTDSGGRQKPVFSGLTAMVERQNRIAVVGVNGAGKTTFLKVISGQTPATEGEAIIGPSISIGYFGQFTLEQLDPESTVLETVQAKLPQLTEPAVRNLLASFLFRNDEVYKKIKLLSGGEKARVILSYLLSTPHNCLILDEPTNHLDIKSRAVLLDALKRYEGTILLVSHDRYFLKELINRVFEVDHGHIKVYEGNYQYYLDSKKITV